MLKAVHACPWQVQEARVTSSGGTCTEVFWTCHLHALSTEVEEVMGLLLGDVLVRAANLLMPEWQS